MGYTPPPSGHDDDIEYVGAPTEFADAVEVPEWVATLTKVLFFLPAAFVTAAAVPLLLGIVALGLCLCLVVVVAAVGAIF